MSRKSGDHQEQTKENLRTLLVQFHTAGLFLIEEQRVL